MRFTILDIRDTMPIGCRCVDGRVMRHDPQHDDPDLETDIGQCPLCDGDGCKSNEELEEVEAVRVPVPLEGEIS